MTSTQVDEYDSLDERQLPSMLSISPIAPLYLAPVIKEKLNMTTIFEEADGNVKTVPATILCVKKGGNMVTDKRWPEKHGHYSVQVGYERYEPNKQLGRRGHLLKKGIYTKKQIGPNIPS